MNLEPADERLRELSWRRPLTPTEAKELRAWCAAHPEALAEAETEVALSEALASLPDARVPSNFTARVWQSIQQDEAAEKRASKASSSRWWRVLVPRLAVATVVLGAGLLTYRHHQSVQKVQSVKSFLAVTSPSMTDPKVIADFDVICQLSPTTAADEELLRLMQ